MFHFLIWNALFWLNKAAEYATRGLLSVWKVFQCRRWSFIWISIFSSIYRSQYGIGSLLLDIINWNSKSRATSRVKDLLNRIDACSSFESECNLEYLPIRFETFSSMWRVCCVSLVNTCLIIAFTAWKCCSAIGLISISIQNHLNTSWMQEWLIWYANWKQNVINLIWTRLWV